MEASWNTRSQSSPFTSRAMVPEMKCELDFYEYVLVQTEYVLFTPSTYLVRTSFPEYVRGTFWYVLCLQKYCIGCCFISYACGKRYYMCLTCMLWCSNTESVPCWCPTYMALFWYILSTYRYVPVCTDIHFLYRSVLGRYSCVLVRTEYPVPVMHVTIPDVFAGLDLLEWYF